MNLSAKEAAELVGMTKQGIIRSIHKGKLTATRNIHNEFEIDRAELFRVFTPKPINAKVDTTTETVVDDNETTYQIKSLQEKVAMLEQTVVDQKQIIANLFDRLAAQQQVTLMLETKQPKSFWNRLFGGN